MIFGQSHRCVFPADELCLPCENDLSQGGMVMLLEAVRGFYKIRTVEYLLDELIQCKGVVPWNG